jgi:cytochrome bd-type quinol oxidase subunit 2
MKSMNTLKRWSYRASVFAVSLLLIAKLPFMLVAYAVSTPPTEAPIETEPELAGFLCNIISWFFWIILVISVIMILYAAFTYATARGDEEKTTVARRTITYAAIGIIIALIATGFPSIVSSIFPQNPGANLADTCTF